MSAESIAMKQCKQERRRAEYLRETGRATALVPKKPMGPAVRCKPAADALEGAMNTNEVQCDFCGRVYVAKGKRSPQWPGTAHCCGADVCKTASARRRKQKQRSREKNVR